MLRRVPLHARAVAAVVALAVSALAAPHAAAAAPGVASPAGIVVQQGDHSSTVAAVQQRLVDAGITVAGGVDGMFGPRTAAAVKEYQRRRGLTVTGTVDTATATALGVVPATALLARGARGTAVTQVQKQLIAVGIRPSGGADGVYGPATESAVRQFQHSRGLGETGSVDAATSQILANAAAAAAPSTPAVPPAPSTIAALGSRGAVVTKLQKDLIAVGLRPAGGADGVYGQATSAKVKQFQKTGGLPATGVYDTVTAAALTAAADTARASGGGSAGGGGGGGGGSSTPPSGTSSDGKVRLAVFPTSPRCTFIDTFGAPRSGGRHHEGVDIIAPLGTPIYAVQSGTITKRTTNGVLSGNALWLGAADGTYFFYAHLNAFAAGIAPGVPVKAGDLIGYVGKTGNAGITHLHFEVHPRGGAAVNPYPVVKAVSGC